MLAGLVIACVLILWIMHWYANELFNYSRAITNNYYIFCPAFTSNTFFVLLIFSILIVINYYKWDLNPIVSKKLVSAIEVEGFDGVGYNEAGNFCSVFKHSPNELNKQCQELTKKNCLLTDCCGWLSALQNKKCIAGDKGGPKAAIENNKLDIMYDPVINILDHWEHREKLVNDVMRMNTMFFCRINHT